jgi:hypothetical protein
MFTVFAHQMFAVCIGLCRLQVKSLDLDMKLEKSYGFVRPAARQKAKQEDSMD